MPGTRKTTQSIDSRILAWGRASVFVPGDFLDLGSREAVDLACTGLPGKEQSAAWPAGFTTSQKSTRRLVCSRRQPTPWPARWPVATAPASSLRAPTRQTSSACQNRSRQKPTSSLLEVRGRQVVLQAHLLQAPSKFSELVLLIDVPEKIERIHCRSPWQ